MLKHHIQLKRESSVPSELWTRSGCNFSKGLIYLRVDVTGLSPQAMKNTTLMAELNKSELKMRGN